MKKNNLNSSKLKEIIVILFQTILITGITLLSVAPISCKVTTEGIKILEGDYSPPILQSFSVINDSELQLFFSEDVKISGCIISPVLEGINDSDEHSDNEYLSSALAAAAGLYGSIKTETVYHKESKNIIDVLLTEETEIGKKYELYGTVEDSYGNSLTFSLYFIGYNSRQAKIIMTEIQSESISSQRTQEKKDGIYRNEYIEFMAVSNGNLAGLEIISAYDGEEKSFVFPPVDVFAGEVFLVHLRNRGNGCISELTEDLSEAFSSYTNNNIRDLWSTQTETALGNKTDIIILKDKYTGKTLDAIMYRAENIAEWTKVFIPYSEMINECEIYSSGSIENAFITTGLTSTKTIARNNVKELQQKIIEGEEIEYPLFSDCNSWYISSEATPGEI